MVGERLFGGGVHRIRLLLVGVEDVISLIRRVLEKGVVLEEYVEVVMEEVVEEGDGEMCRRFLLSSFVIFFTSVGNKIRYGLWIESFLLVERKIHVGGGFGGTVVSKNASTAASARES